MHKILVVILGIITAATGLWSQSFYTVRPNDPKAIYLTREQFGVKADGTSDDTAAIQKAIDKVQDATDQGIVFVPEGRYRITKTLFIWPGIRVIGYGAHRPVFVLADNAPAFQDSAHENYMIFFAGGRPGIPSPWPAHWDSNGRPPEANPGTFYSAVSNIDIEIGNGNPGAVAVRGTYAQHSFLAHMDFRLRSGIAAVHDTGNVMEDVKFFGGKYGIWTRKPSPGWQLTVVDAVFEGQKEAAIRETEAGLTMIRPHFRNVPSAISIDDGFPEQLWIEDGVMEDITGPAIVVSFEKNPRTQIGLEDVVCRRVATFAVLRESGKKFTAPGAIYKVASFSHGLSYSDVNATPEVRDVYEAKALSQMPAAPKSDFPPLPAGDTWANVRDLGAKGDGKTDDTAAFRAAIASHRTIYIPSGYYVVSDTLTLKPDTVLIGLHPSETQIDLLDHTPAFQGVGSPKPVIEAPAGGTNIMTGIGVYTNGINPRAVAVKWMAGTNSLMNDVRFLGGHGTSTPFGNGAIYNNTHTADPDLNRRWDSQYPSLWVTNGGGGTFFDIWTPSTFAQAGMLVSDTSTEGRVYEMSSEHHVRHEVQLRNVSNWKIYALQTEEERGESGFALPLEIDNSSNITVTNLHMYRVISSFQPFPWAVKVSRSRNVRFFNVHCDSNSKVSFDTTVYDQTHDAELRQHDFGSLTVSDVPLSDIAHGPITGSGTKLEKLATGFYNAAGGALAPNGDFYFVDSKWQRIYKWDVAQRQLVTVRDTPLDPDNLAFDKAGNLMVVSYAGKGIVYTFKPGEPGNDISILSPVTASARPGLTPVLPNSDWVVQHKDGNALPRTHQFLSPDGTTYISATDGFLNGETSWGVKSSDLIRAFSLSPAAYDKPFYFTSESDVVTWRADIAPDGNFTHLKLFTHQGGEGVTTDASGNVYIVAGQVYVYNPNGELIDTIRVPERPTQALFSKDGHTLFILTRSSLYSLKTSN